MTPAWVDEVWKQSKNAGIHCDDEQFEKFKCLPFHNLVICCTGYQINEREELEQTIQKYGGKFVGPLDFKIVQVLVCKGIA